jgi:hypothetical protein
MNILHFSSWLFKTMNVKPMFLKCILVCIKCKYHPKVDVEKMLINPKKF